MNKIIYILVNAAIPGLCKIGHTNNLKLRLQQLSRHAGVPLPFECFYAKKVHLGAREIEQWLHSLFEKDRINPRKEFFTVPPEKVSLALKYIEGEEIMLEQNVIPEDKQEANALKKEAQRRDNFNFKRAKILPGSTLTFIYDDKVTCTTLANGQVMFQNNALSISEAARKAYKKEYRVSGPLYWKYNDETLDERCKRIDNGE